MAKFYVDAEGNYLGGFDKAEPPAGAVEIDKPPKHGWDKYDHAGKKWVPYVPPPAPPSVAEQLAVINARLTALEGKVK